MPENTDLLSQIITGNAATARASFAKGWVIGHMREGIAQTVGLEVKEWFYAEDPNYGIKAFEGTEFFNVVEGELTVELQVPGGDQNTPPKRFVLSGETRDHIIIPPGCIKRVLVTKAPASGITVRWPSIPGINKIIEPGS